MLVNCVAYQDGKKLGDIMPSEISDYVSRPECFVWVALFEPSPEELDAMKEEFGLHELAVEDARPWSSAPEDRGVQRIRCLPSCKRSRSPAKT